MTCPLCQSPLRRQRRLELVSAIQAAFRDRLSCTNPACRVTGFHRPATGQWVFFDDLANGAPINPQQRLRWSPR